jgi:hypothetical protein
MVTEQNSETPDAAADPALGYGVAGIPGRHPIGITGYSIHLKGTLTDQGVRILMGSEDDDVQMDRETTRDLAGRFLEDMGITPTPDALSQLVEVFIPCLRIMCSRPWEPDGSTWRRSGRLGVLTDAHKKWDRFWFRLWRHGKLHDDSGLDLINFIGFTLRSDDNGWGEWGEPGPTDRDNV